MKPLAYVRAGSLEQALQLHSAGSHCLGGGTNLVDLMRKGVEQPSALVDLTHLAHTVELREDGSLLLGAGAKNSAVAAHPAVRGHFPMLSRALLAGASAQIRNMATVGGNLMQRTRCLYFADQAGSRCNKRTPGSGCDAQGGFARYHAVVGGSSACIATHPSDMCVALAALDAVVHLASPEGTRTLPLTEFHRLPGDRPELDTELRAHEIITAVEIPPSRFARSSTYRKVRDRASYAFALVSVAAGLTLQDGRISAVRIALGGVAPKPGRALRAEAALLGQAPTREALQSAAGLEFAEATPPPDAAFKVELARRLMVATLSELSGGAQ